MALGWKGARPTQRDFDEPSSHLVALISAVSELLEGARGRIEDIDRVALIWGPGSFTGLRIGLAFVKGLYAAKTVDVVVVNTLEMLALQSTGPVGRICSMVDARKDEVYVAVYEALPPVAPGDGGARSVKPVMLPQALPPLRFLSAQQVCPTLFVGSGACRYAATVSSVFGRSAVIPGGEADRVSTSILCELAPSLEPLPRARILALEPFYIRPADAKLRPLRTVRTHD